VGSKAVLWRTIDARQVRLVVAILLLNLLDAFCTLRHTSYGARELNPVMAELLGAGSLRFVTVKHLLVSLGVLAIVVRSDQPLARRALRAVLVLFACVAVYHGALWILTG
jgi:hypothetical protein